MNNRSIEVQEWWTGNDGEKRAFFRDIMELAEGVGDGQLLRLEFNGYNFTPRLFGGRGGAEAVKTGAAAELSPEAWWATLPNGMRAFVPMLADLVDEIMCDQDKAIEVRRTERGFKATLVLRFKRPVGGSAQRN